jgi:hypothetical protein
VSLYLPTTEENALPFVETEAGRCVPVFSSADALSSSWPEGGRYLRVPREALGDICPDGVGVLLDGRVTLTVEAASTLREPLVGEPREEPTELLATLRAFADGAGDVRAAYRAQLVPPAGEPVIAVGFEVDFGVDERTVIGDAAVAARDAGIVSLVFVPLADGGELARFLLERTQPFWVRET